VPFEVVSVCPDDGVPVMVGRAVLTGLAVRAWAVVAFEKTAPEPPELVAVTTAIR